MKTSRGLLVLGMAVFSAGLLMALDFVTGEAEPSLPPLPGLSIVAPENLPGVGTFWSVQKLDSENTEPPLPFVPFKDLIVYSLGEGHYAYDDRLIDYQALAEAAEMEKAALMAGAAALGLELEEFDGGGMVMMMSVGSNDLWLEITGAVITNGSEVTSWFVIHPPESDGTDYSYDLFGTTNLSADVPGLNLTNWTWVLRADAGVTNVVAEDLVGDAWYFRAATTNDTDGDWMSDAFEALVSHSDISDADQNTNGIPDGWEWEHFGNLDQAADGDFDGDEVNNGDEYTNGSDPNTITFSLSFGSGYFNGDTATGAVMVLSGIPSSMAALINSTNLAEASWQPFNSNLVACLGTNDGSYRVWIGLRGWAKYAQQEWHGITLIRDTVPPVITVTAPASTVVRPKVQLLGRVSESVSSLSYDLTNSSVSLSNQPGYITEAQPDTSTWTFTTNFFQCYDVLLAGGGNQITLHATDLAGNVSVTNVTLNLDSSGNTNPPVITVQWPLTNVPVAGAQFTLQGMLDDDSATVLVSGLGTSRYTGIVERGGRFRVANLPLPAATNVLTLAVTNANGIGSTLQWAVLKSVIGVEMNALTSAELSQTFVTVTGNVSDDSQDVWVNDVQATVEPGGDWHADNVSVPHSSGQGKFDIKVYPPGSVPEETQPLAEQALVVGMPPVVSLIGYVKDRYSWRSGACGEYPLWTKDQTVWSAGQGGQQFHDSWHEPHGQGETYTNYLSGDYPPITQWEFRSIRDAYVEQSYATECNGWYVSRSMKDHNETPLLSLSAAASAQTEGSQLIRLTVTVLSNDVPVSPSSISLFGQSAVTTATNAAVGEVFVLQPSGSTRNIPITVNGVHNYTFSVFAEPVGIRLATDVNHDGSISFDFTDAALPSRPFRFWINDDTDDGDIADGDSDVPGATSGANGDDELVNGRCDVIDFFPVALSFGDALQRFPLTNGFEYRLSHPTDALNFVYASLSLTNAFDYLTTLLTNGYGENFDQGPHEAGTIQITSQGVVLSTNFLNRVATNGNTGIILVEGRSATQKPLALEIWRSGQYMAGIPLEVSIRGVEDMFRHLNLRDGEDAPENLPGTANSGDVGLQSRMNVPPNHPDNPSDSKWLIFVHGYNVSAEESRGWESEIFKRFYWSGSRARYIGVDWLGNPDGEGIDAVADYHYAVMNAFPTAAKLAEKINALSGSKTIVGHSLGCGVTAIAISDHGLQVDHACLVDAALASECFDGDSAEEIAHMAYSPWTQSADPSTPNYPRELWAADWHKRFQSTNDARQTLTWKNRFTNSLSVIHNFYSSTEDVLGIWPGAPTTVLIENIIQLGGLGNFAWVMQEKTKGNKLQLLGTINLTGSDYGGWGFNFHDPITTNLPAWYLIESSPSPGYRRIKTPSEIGTLTQTLLDGSRYAPLFNSGWGSFDPEFPAAPIVNTFAHTGPDWILDLYHVQNGNTIAADPAKRTQLLAQAIPALSPPAGWQPLVAIPSRNYNMPVEFATTPWPRPFTSGLAPWFHNDIRELAFLYTHRFYKEIVSIAEQ